MGYAVEVRGRVLLRADQETEAFTRLRDILWRGERLDGPADDFISLAAMFCTVPSRDGDWIDLAPVVDGDPKWSDRASAFYGALAEWVANGEVVATGEDGVKWTYSYLDGLVTQVGTNGYDGATSVAIHNPASHHEPETPAQPGERPPRLQSNTANLLCSSDDVTAVGHPAPWTSVLSTTRRSGDRIGTATDDLGLSYVLSLLAEDKRTASEHARFVSLIEQQLGELGDPTDVVAIAASTRMIVIVVTASPAFTREQLARITDLQTRLDALLVYEELLTYRRPDGSTLTVELTS